MLFQYDLKKARKSDLLYTVNNISFLFTLKRENTEREVTQNIYKLYVNF